MLAISFIGFITFIQSAVFVLGYISNNSLFPEPLTADEEKTCLERLKNQNRTRWLNFYRHNRFDKRYK